MTDSKRRPPGIVWALRRLGFFNFNANGFEAKSLNFLEECSIHFPGKQWNELTHQERTEVIRLALQPDSFLLNPNSEYMKYWDLVIVVALLFTGIVTPYEVIFTYQVAADNWLFAVNRLVDGIFIKDMVMQFFLKVEMPSQADRYGSVLLKDPRMIRWRYLTTWFPIDFVSILPFDVFLMLYQGSPALGGIKIFRMARLLRLVKLVRILRTSRLVVRWQNYFAISFAVQKLAKFNFFLMLSSHWMACAWGLTGLSFGKELCDATGQRLYFDEGEVALQDRSWMVYLFTDGKTSPDNPCNPWHVYTTALYWSVMTITSIGYGDIYPVRNEEYMVCILCMLLGGVLWAYIIGSLCGVMANGDPVESDFESNMDLLNAMLRDARVPVPSRRDYREYLREAKVYDANRHFRNIASTFSPLLKGKLLMHVTSVAQSKKAIFYLRDAPETCLMELVDAMGTFFFSRRETLVSLSNLLCVLERGTVVRAGRICSPGSAFNLDFIVARPRLRKREHTVALTYSLVNGLAREPFFDIVNKYPSVAKVVVKAGHKLAFIRTALLCAQKHHENSEKSTAEKGKTSMSFMQCFQTLQLTDAVGDPSRLDHRIEPRRRSTSGSDDKTNQAVPMCQGSSSEKTKTAVRTVEAALADQGPDRRLAALETSLVASVSATQARLAEMQSHLEEFRKLRLEVHSQQEHTGHVSTE